MIPEHQYHVTPYEPKEGDLVLGVVIHLLAWERLVKANVDAQLGITHLGWVVRDAPDGAEEQADGY